MAPERPEGGAALVLGLGNVLMGDDGFGPYAVRLFESRYETGPGVSALDAGTPGLDLTPYLLGVSHLVVLDTVRAGAPPGGRVLLDRERLLALPRGPRVNPHDPGLQETLLTLDFAGRLPPWLLLVGVEPVRVERGTGLTGAVRRAAHEAADEAARILTGWGFEVHRREIPLAPDIWWEKGRREPPAV
jgi:hydrogenase maturation protease